MTIANYVRMSTEEKNLDCQLESTYGYAERVFDAAPGDVETYRDQSTGTNTDRSDYRRLMANVESGDVDVVIIYTISRMSRSIRDLNRTAERIVEENGAELPIVNEGLTLSADKSDHTRRRCSKCSAITPSSKRRWLSSRHGRGSRPTGLPRILPRPGAAGV